MIDFDISNIDPTETNARSIVTLTSGDLIRARLSDAQIMERADPNNPAHIERQRGMLEEHPGRYLGAFVAHELVGFAKVNEWNRYDQLPFIPPALRLAQRALAHLNNHLGGLPQGIHGFVVDSGDVYDEFLGMSLLNEALTLAQGSEVRIAQYQGDPMSRIIQESGFRPTGKHGTVVGIQQELYVRPAKTRAFKTR